MLEFFSKSQSCGIKFTRANLVRMTKLTNLL